MIEQLAEAVLTCTHSLLFWSQIKKNCIVLPLPYESGVRGYNSHGHVISSPEPKAHKVSL